MMNNTKQKWYAMCYENVTEWETRKIVDGLDDIAMEYEWKTMQIEAEFCTE